MEELKGRFVTATVAGEEGPRQGAVISTDPLRIRGQSGQEWNVVGTPVIVDNPPSTCIGCDLPLGQGEYPSFCKRCEANLDALAQMMRDHGVRLDLVDVRVEGKTVTMQIQPSQAS